MYVWYRQNEILDWHLHSEQCVNQQKNGLNFQHLCWDYYVYTSVEIYSLGQVIYSTFIVRPSWVKQHINWQLLRSNIADICISIICTCHPFLYYFIFGTKIQHSI